MNGHCDSCDMEHLCGYKYKPTDCCDYKKYVPQLCSKCKELPEKHSRTLLNKIVCPDPKIKDFSL